MRLTKFQEHCTEWVRSGSYDFHIAEADYDEAARQPGPFKQEGADVVGKERLVSFMLPQLLLVLEREGREHL